MPLTECGRIKRLSCIFVLQGFTLIPYRRQAMDFIHGFAVILRVAFLYYEHKTKTESGRTPFLFCLVWICCHRHPREAVGADVNLF